MTAYKVALVRVSADYQPEIAVSADGDRWYVAGPRLGSQHGWYADRIEIIRPLVVLDPESREDAARALQAFHGIPPECATSEDLAETAASLLLLTRPPKPAEPTGPAVLVRDRNGDTWASTAWGLWVDLTSEARTRKWCDIDAVEVVRP